MIIPRNEYPRPQFVRRAWTNLNGEWDFEIDNAMCGEEKRFYERKNFDRKIVVPFCPESRLSGVENTDFMLCVWYRRDIEIPKEYADKRVILHFGAVDYLAKVYVNGVHIGGHKGGYTPFSFDITEALKEDGNYITLCVYDDVRSGNQPAGKQSAELESKECSYTRTTGIWQTVWLEYVDECRMDSVKILTDIDTPSVTFGFKVSAEALGAKIKAEVYWDGRAVGEVSANICSLYTELSTALSEKHLWSTGLGNLYDVKFTLEKDGTVLDEAESYFGLRSVYLEGRKFKINGETVFGRWVLDQGYYPDGIYTAPTDEALKADIEYSMQLGFNGARLHEKLFEPRFLYWADRLGYLVWDEYANWQLDITEAGQIQHFLPEWNEAIERDFNHPSVIGWCPFNETWDNRGRKQCDYVVEQVYRITKLLDPTRPVIDSSGHFHVATDIFDVHDYEQNPKEFAAHFDKMDEGIIEDVIARSPRNKDRQKYDGKQPVFVSEYGGIKWANDETAGWGYGDAPKTPKEFIDRYRGLAEAMLGNEKIMGFCYTQLYDIEQEVNGLMTYDRKFKFAPEIIREINSQKAKIEE